MSDAPVVKQNPDGTFEAQAFGHTFVTNPDGSAEIKMANGQVITVSQDGSMNSVGVPYKAVEIANLLMLTKHNISMTPAGTEHDIEFVGGGSCKIVFDASGTFRSLSGTALQATQTNDNRLILIGSADKKMQ